MESLAIELHNTLSASGDALDRPREWLAGLSDRLPQGSPSHAALGELRVVVRRALQATLAGELPDRATLAALNAAVARAPVSPRVRVQQGRLVATTDHHGATRAEIVLAAFAADAIDLITSGAELHACGAPGCVLIFRKDHPRRAWCSDACGNRARQARHYARTRG